MGPKMSLGAFLLLLLLLLLLCFHRYIFCTTYHHRLMNDIAPLPLLSKDQIFNYEFLAGEKTKAAKRRVP
ncbi:predicted protein [Histoplasma mississippiense (nom. inval.)]|uniref:predicted protein n=1 Tax=Ajellomyces capsulatus (strain NAm1 / WU24) TaxID=2059318 RepID=UPI000157B78E|nr:predicted protein [Histoplasma mississippiense (nom. inval.)]EDN04122.1 predicted protein [Histoplasma mississippiense (nom. inval.)]